MPSEILSIGTLIGVLIVAIGIVSVLQAGSLPVIICRHCRYHNRPRNTRCWWCGKPL